MNWSGTGSQSAFVVHKQPLLQLDGYSRLQCVVSHIPVFIFYPVFISFMFQKKEDTQYMAVSMSNFNGFPNFFACIFSPKFAVVSDY